jgi:hypothetical protein
LSIFNDMKAGDCQGGEGVLGVSDFGPDGRPGARREARFAVTRRVSLLPYSTKSDCWAGEAWLADCSTRGVGLLTNTQMYPGEQFLLKLKAAGSLLLVICTTRNCRPAPPDRYRIGAIFDGYMRDGELHDANALHQLLIAANDPTATGRAA